ncbi:MAG TPA: class I SAM-dependent methyltransferase [Myxococcales bacterium]|nr:class I SAM-dependent methyltransferase [Myxococcales bacterium]
MAPADGDRKETAAGWDSHWAKYDQATRQNPAHRFRRALIISQLERSARLPMRILDLGCGQGDFLREARERFPDAQLAGVDGSAAGLELARRRVAGARLFRTDLATDDPLPSELHGFATHVICSEVLEHLDEPALALRKAAQALAPHGHLIVTVPGGPRSAFDIHIGHRRHYSPRELESLVRAAGYEPIDVRGAGFPVFNLYRLAVILQGRRLARKADQATPQSRAFVLAMTAFDWLFRLSGDRTRLGWQTFGVFKAISR